MPLVHLKRKSKDRDEEMLTAKRITKQDLPLLRDAAQRLVQTRGKGVVRASMQGITIAGNTTYGIFMDGIIVGWKVLNKDGRVIAEMGITTLEDGGLPVFADDAKISGEALEKLGFAERFDHQLEDREVESVLGYEDRGPDISLPKDRFDELRRKSAAAFGHEVTESAVVSAANKKKQRAAEQERAEAERQAKLARAAEIAENPDEWADEESLAESKLDVVGATLLANAERNAAAHERYGVRGRRAAELNRDPFADVPSADAHADVPADARSEASLAEDPFAGDPMGDRIDSDPFADTGDGNAETSSASKSPHTSRTSHASHSSRTWRRGRGKQARRAGSGAPATSQANIADDDIMFGRVDSLIERPSQSPLTQPKKPAPKLSPVKIIIGVILVIMTLAGSVVAAVQGLSEISGGASGGSEMTQIPQVDLDWDSYEQAQPGELIHVRVLSGMTPAQICETLAESGLVSCAKGFMEAVDAQDAYSDLTAGEYIVPAGESADSLVSRMAAGKRVPQGVIGVNNGDTLSTIATTIDKAGLPYNGGDFLNSANDVEKWRSAFSMLSDVPADLPTIEGYLASDEYDLSSTASADAAISMMMEPVQEMFEKSGMSSMEFHDMLTKASLIEKEALFDEDRPLISSVIDNRLAAGAKLQIDAAVKYANDYDEARVYDSHLEIDSPYNTYMYAGLPIGPICSGIAQMDIDAAMNPAETDYFYYVLEDTEGHHRFCVTSEEFEVAKSEYLRLFGYDQDEEGEE